MSCPSCEEFADSDILLYLQKTINTDYQQKIGTISNSIAAVSVAILYLLVFKYEFLIYLKWYSLHDFNRNISKFCKTFKLDNSFPKCII